LFLDGYDFDIIYKLGKENCVADLLTKEGKYILQQSIGIPEIKMFHKASSSSKHVEPTPKGLKWILVCGHCKYFYCFDCIVSHINSSQFIDNVFHKWINKYNSRVSNVSYFEHSPKMYSGDIHSGQLAGQRYIVIEESWLWYNDYCAIISG
jgi:hypothetical protein